MSRLVYENKVVFSDFKLYREANNSGGCDYSYPENETTIDEWEEVNVYICPHCIKKYGLYEETETTKEEIDDAIKMKTCGDYFDLTCGVSGCGKNNPFEGWLHINKSKLECCI